jgi:hypothetical protein
MYPIEEILKGKSEKRLKYFYHFCMNDFNVISLKKAFIDPKLKKYIDNNLLVAGLLGSIEKKFEKYVDLIFEFIEQNQINLNKDELNIIFNCAASMNNIEIIDYLDEKFSVIQKFLSATSEGHLNNFDRNTKQKLVYSNFINFDEYLQHHNQNPLTLALTRKNFTLLDKILETDNKISLSLIKSAFIRCIEEGERDTIMYLLNHNKTSKFLLNHGTIKEALSDNGKHSDLKKEVSIILDKRALDRTLKVNDEMPKSKLKL